ncbi:hypothetical protein UFOVP53_74 [uncultured Caudovirales phage]|uniref:Uncharacterized protein n=1 Tax=uncultured Caudovirales phage TaxID=2100421 RepID=A0A6J5KVG5_9CAUD|nr:hypothetical protein UFOVP53_74 [uncultured Caudovirales phage]
MARQFFKGSFKHKVSNSAITDLTMPTFAGITSLIANPNGSLSINASAATDVSTPVKYEIYISTTNVSLFSLSNISLIVNSLPCLAFQDSSGNILTSQLYYVGIRAVDSVGNRNTNTVILSATSVGMPDTSTFSLLTSLNAKIGTPTLSTVSADINSRLASSSYVAPDNTDILAIKAKTDNLPIDPASNTQVNTRLATSSYVAPDNTSITAIKSKTDQLNFTLGNINSIAVVVSDKTGYELTSTERSAISVAVESALINDTDGQALIATIVAAIGNVNVDEAALVTAIRSDIERSGGMLENTKLNTSLIPALL